MKRALSIICVPLLAGVVWGAFSFYPIDDLESGKAEKWYKFGNLRLEVVANPSAEANDLIAESAGVYSLQLSGKTTNWYVGGIGRELQIDAAKVSRLQLDIYGSVEGGKLRIELFDDDNNNYSLEQDSARDWLATKDDKWIAEIPVLGKGFTRISIPFSSFKLDNRGSGNGLWDPKQENGSGGLLKLQLVLLCDKPLGEAKVRIDNILLTY